MNNFRKTYIFIPTFFRVKIGFFTIFVVAMVIKFNLVLQNLTFLCFHLHSSMCSHKHKYRELFFYTEYAGLDIAVILCIASLFSRQIAIGNAGPNLALKSMGAKPTFAAIF